MTRQEHGQCDVTSPLDGTIAQTYNLLHRFTGMDDRYSAKTITGTNGVRYDIHIYAKKNARLILCFHVGTGKNVYIVLSGSPRQSSMALAGGLRGNRKGLYRLHLACL